MAPWVLVLFHRWFSTAGKEIPEQWLIQISVLPVRVTVWLVSMVRNHLGDSDYKTKEWELQNKRNGSQKQNLKNWLESWVCWDCFGWLKCTKKQTKPKQTNKKNQQQGSYNSSKETSMKPKPAVIVTDQIERKTVNHSGARERETIVGGDSRTPLGALRRMEQPSKSINKIKTNQV